MTTSKIIKNKAFTLFEVLIALAVLAIAMVAGILTSDYVISKSIGLERRVLAHWVGMNVINNLELKLLKDKLQVMSTTGSSIQKGQKFNWDLEVVNNKVQDIILLNARVKVYQTSTEGAANVRQQLARVERNVIINK